MHRYSTRFQAKATQATFQAKQLQVVPVRVYQTRLQTKKIQAEQRRAAEAKTLLDNTVKYSHEMMNRIDKTPILVEKLELILLLYQHFYDNPILLTTYEHFRVIVWDKMNEREVTLLAKLQTLPARLSENSAYDMRFRDVIHQLLDQMESLRIKYW